MKQLISYCGLDCETCEGRIATLNNDDALRAEIAIKWSAQFGDGAHFTPEMINCTGCRVEGAKIGHCSECGMRNCATAKGYATCGDCSEVDTCEIIGELFKMVPQALENLKS